MADVTITDEMVEAACAARWTAWDDWSENRKNAERQQTRFALTAALAQAPTGVKVKPLEWQSDDRYPDSVDHAHADGIGTVYRVSGRIWNGKRGRWMAWLTGSLECDDWYEDMQAAKAAAQADYEARILAALSSPAQGQREGGSAPKVADPDNLDPVHIRLLQRGARSKWIGLSDDAGTRAGEVAALGELHRAGLVKYTEDELPPGPPSMTPMEITEAGRRALSHKEGGMSGRELIGKPPYKYWPRAQMVMGTDEKLGGDVIVCDIRGWGYLTGKGHGALGLPEEEASRIQDAFGEEIARLLNLTTAGYRLLAPGELDRETLERAAEVVTSGVIHSKDAKKIAIVIRALKEQDNT